MLTIPEMHPLEMLEVGFDWGGGEEVDENLCFDQQGGRAWGPGGSFDPEIAIILPERMAISMPNDPLVFIWGTGRVWGGLNQYITSVAQKMSTC